MTGPYPPEFGAGPTGPQMYPPSIPYPENVPSAYPGMLPPPVSYRKRKRWPIVAGALAAVAVIAAIVAAIVLAGGRDESPRSGALTDDSAKAAIQEYLDALTNGDDETVARHASCGFFDAVKEKRSDLALASLSGDAFRKQYSSAEVTTIDKVVSPSPNQAQVLFTMRVTPASGSGRGQSDSDEQQAVAQLLTQNNEILVCSYLPRTGGQY
jgi:ketosteroid isomerase-like protein